MDGTILNWRHREIILQIVWMVRIHGCNGKLSTLHCRFLHIELRRFDQHILVTRWCLMATQARKWEVNLDCGHNEIKWESFDSFSVEHYLQFLEGFSRVNHCLCCDSKFWDWSTIDPLFLSNSWLNFVEPTGSRVRLVQNLNANALASGAREENA